MSLSECSLTLGMEIQYSAAPTLEHYLSESLPKPPSALAQVALCSAFAKRLPGAPA